MTYLAEMNVETGFISPDAVGHKGLELADSYQVGSPFPHIVIDDFLPPEILDVLLDEFPSDFGQVGVRYDREQERYKSNFNPDVLMERSRAIFYAFNSRPFIKILENITGIKGLIPDPFFLGAGLHETTQGGHLSIHADFNHHKPMNLERRINVLIYLNRNWESEYGGSLELWDRNMKVKVQSVIPKFNRCVMFNTDSDNYHGNPEPVDHPERAPRRSIALYYYTSTWSGAKREHTTQFKVRAGSADGVDWRVRTRELIADLTPPIVQRAFVKVRGHRP